MKASELVEQLNLLPHPEGGFYKETYRSSEHISQNALPERFSGDRSFSTAIYFLIKKNNFSALHKIKSDETWHFYEGDALEVIEINEEGHLKSTFIGRDLNAGELFQYTVRANVWFGSRVKQGGDFSLVGCTVAPGFDFADFEMADRINMIENFPQHQLLIEAFTRV